MRESIENQTDLTPNLNRIHKGSLLKKDVVKTAAFYSHFYKYAMRQFFLAFIIAPSSILLSNFPVVAGIIFMFGWLVGFTTPVTVIISNSIYKKATFLGNIVSEVRKNEIMYLYDNIFDGITFNRRILMAKKLVASVNLSNYELIDDVALVKKKLHLSAQSVREFIKTDSFGLVSRISSEQFLVLESKALIRDKKLEKAIKDDMYTFYEDEGLASVHKNKCWERPLQKTFDLHKTYSYLAPIAVAVGVAMIVLSSVIIFTSNKMELMTLWFFGFTALFSPIFFSGKAKEILKAHDYMKVLLLSLDNRETVDIRDRCFNGLSFSQRIVIINKLIESKHLKNKKLCFEKIIVPVSYSDENAQKQIELAENKKIAQFLSSNNLTKYFVETSTNCKYCGGVLKEERTFCTYCGKKIQMQSKSKLQKKS